jgi:quercetin dioxygenase-like cupin family protein
MKRFVLSRKRAAVAAGLAVIGAAGIYVLPSGAQDPPPPIVSEPLTPRSVFPDDVTVKFTIKLDGRATKVVSVRDPSRTIAARFTIQPGAQFPWHSHRGPVVVNVVEGALTYVPEDTCAEHTYEAGEAFVDPGQGHVHTAFNPTGGVTILVATFFAAPAEGSLLIPADPAC